MSKKYKNPPVVEALCEIFFGGSKWDSTLPGLFFEKVKKDFPKKRELDQIGVEVSISKDTHGSQVIHGEKRLQLVKEDNSRLIQIEKDLLVVNQLRPYPRFKDWRPVIDEMLKHYSDLAQPAGVQRLGVRYINRIVIPAAKFQMEDYFYLYPEVPQSLGAIHGKFMVRVEIPPKNKGHLLMITFSTAPADSPETSALMLDIYDIFPFSQLLSIEKVDKYIDEAHDNIEMAFETSITEKTRDLFEKEA